VISTNVSGKTQQLILVAATAMGQRSSVGNVEFVATSVATVSAGLGDQRELWHDDDHAVGSITTRLRIFACHRPKQFRVN